MAGDNKILTVSFGTFSCTVEGFDDPLGTMREITEYFRDLSAEDRYFGAEPLTPEPERMPMLADRRASPRANARPGRAHATLGQAEAKIDDADEMTGDEAAPAEPAEPAAEAPARAPVPTTPEPPAETTAEAPAEAPVVTAAETHVETTAEVHVETTAEARVETTAEAPVEPDAEAPVEPDAEPAAEPPAAQAPPPTPHHHISGSATERLARIRAAAGPDLADAAIPGEEEEDALAPEPVPEPAPEISAAMQAEVETEEEAPEALPAEPEPLLAAAEEIDEDEDGAPQVHGVSAFAKTPIDAGGTADRIFREAGHALEDIEARRRHSAIAHLKAAVSATVNDCNILGWRKRQNEEEEVAYRADLAQAVKPDRRALEPVVPVHSEDAAEMEDYDDDFGGVEASQPLVLGMDARVDPNSLAALALTEEDRVLEEDTRPVRPRASDETFSAFAERMGARGLSDLLEAAAAYSGQIEGRPQFSRPQIMKHVVGVTDDEYSREDGLRSFGALLRQGKIEKLKRGVFALTGNSRFAARPRLAGE